MDARTKSRANFSIRRVTAGLARRSEVLEAGFTAAGWSGQGDVNDIGAVAGSIDMKRGSAPFAVHRQEWKPRMVGCRPGAIANYARTVGRAAIGATSRRGAGKEASCHADI